MAMLPKLVGEKILIPKRAEAEDGTIGDAWVELSPDDPDYDQILAWIKDELTDVNNGGQ